MNRSPIRECVVSRRSQASQILARLQPALGDRDHFVRNQFDCALARLRIDRQRSKIPIVHADDRRARFKRERDLREVVHLDEHVEAGIDR